MKLRSFRQGERAYTLAEAIVAMGMLGVVCSSLYGGMSISIRTIQTTRENLRATQILAQTMEVIRLCNWSQTNPSSNFIPTSITVPYYTDNSSVTNGPYYQLAVTISSAPPVGASYSNDLRMVQIQASWTSCSKQHARSINSYVSQYGMQNYVW